jgi:gas vesicle protein
MMAKRDVTGTIVTFILGVGVGAAAVLLFAPGEAVDELREDVAEAIGEGVDQVRSRSKDLRRRAQKLAAVAADQVQTALEHGEDAFQQAKKAGA